MLTAQIALQNGQLTRTEPLCNRCGNTLGQRIGAAQGEGKALPSPGGEGRGGGTHDQTISADLVPQQDGRE